MKYIFVGLKPSKTAYQKQWTWYDKRLSAKHIWAVIDYLHLKDFLFINIFSHPDIKRDPKQENNIIGVLLRYQQDGYAIVSMGQEVNKIMKIWDFKANYIIPHPAARGSIRKIDSYVTTVCNILNIAYTTIF